MLPVFWRVEWWLSKDEPVLLWLTSQIGINGFVPELLDTFPVFNLPTSEKIADLMGFLVRHGLISDVVIHLITFKFGVFLKKVNNYDILIRLTLFKLVAIVEGIM